MKYKRIFVIVADSLGVGEAKDAAKYGDEGSNTLKHLSYSKIDFSIPNLQRMGIGNITEVYNTPKTDNPIASFGRMEEISAGKDTLTGHWEIMGLEVLTPFPAFTDTGFPQELIKKLEEGTGRKVIGNISASGTEIIKDLGEEHMKTGSIIVYTSADSVLQIAAHEEIVPIPELYDICAYARKITLENKDWMVGRIIARPFVGKDKESFVRTTNRHDYAVKPSGETTLVKLKKAGYDVIAVGKINDIFDGEGITETYKTKSNDNGMDITMEITKKDFKGLCFVNLVDFDALYGHRRDAQGYAKCVEDFDKKLGEFLPLLNDDDLLMICADHGNDPIHSGTDHTRENVPIIVYNKNLKPINLGVRNTYADIAATVAENFGVEKPIIGKSIL